MYTIQKSSRESTIAENTLEQEIHKGTGNKLAAYINDLRSGSEEDKTLAHILMKTVTKPKFNKFLKENSIPSWMSIIEAMVQYRSRDKPYKNDEEKALSVLKGKGYSID